MYQYLHEQLSAMHRHELQQAAERHRLARRLAYQRGSTIHHIAGLLGVFLMKTGMRLKQFELRASMQGA